MKFLYQGSHSHYIGLLNVYAATELKAYIGSAGVFQPLYPKRLNFLLGSTFTHDKSVKVTFYTLIYK